MKDVATIKFKELGTLDDGLVIVRHNDNSVAIALSIQKNGDVEVVMSKSDAKALLEALRNAVQ